ncbi:hypothetical protein [uncultured Olegusella sp.]|uniref:hypothetical protein n=1 Tax=uncultured Olegusella sp. TaxID=1979846 RepID=UPI00261DD7D9|nr:hypothetical protein [uncultured Olegusella sp.]
MYLNVSVASAYCWIEKGNADTANLNLRRKVKYKSRKKIAAPKSTSHGLARSFPTFMELSWGGARSCFRDGYGSWEGLRQPVFAYALLKTF